MQVLDWSRKKKRARFLTETEPSSFNEKLRPSSYLPLGEFLGGLGGFFGGLLSLISPEILPSFFEGQFGFLPPLLLPPFSSFPCAMVVSPD